MKIKQTILALALVIGISGFFISPLVSAAGTCNGVALEAGQSCCGGVVTSIIHCDQPGGETDDITQSGIWGILLLAINILTAGIGVAAVGGIVYGSILYTSAGGDAAGVKKAKEIIVNVVIGLVAYVLMYSFLNYIIPGGLFT